MAYTVDQSVGEYITAGHDKTTALTVMFSHIIANNRAGGWRKIKRHQ